MDSIRSPEQRTSIKSGKLILNNLLSKCNGETSEKDVLIDAPEIAAALQAIGFKIVESDCEISNKKESEDHSTGITVKVTCGRSGLTVVLTKQDFVCKCPEAGARFEKLGPRGDNELMCTDENENNNEDIKTPLGTFPSADNLCNPANDSITKSCRHSPWEVDPKTTPPIRTSSPLPGNAVLTIDQLSICSDRDQTIANCLQEIKTNVDKVLSLLPVKNNTFTKSVIPVKRVSNIMSTPQTPTRSTSAHASADIPVRNLSMKKSTTPRQVLTPKKMISPMGLPTPKRKCLVQPKDTFSHSSTRSPVADRLKISKQDILLFTPSKIKFQKKNSVGILKSTGPTRDLVFKNIAANRSPNSCSTPKARSGIPSLSKIPNFNRKKLK